MGCPHAPRMRTIPQTIEELRKADPNTAVTLRALRRMVSNGEIPTVNIASKKLINLDVLFSLLYGKQSCYNDNAISCVSDVEQRKDNEIWQK